MKKLARRIWNGWKKVALRIARFQTALLLTLFYSLLLVPIGFAARLFGWDPLQASKRHRERPSNWQAVSQDEPDLEALRRQS